MTAPPERYFYHSFPKPLQAPNTEWLDDPVCHEKGLSIIKAICRVGLLLTPERWVLPPEEVSGGTLSKSLPVFQKRLCFTELAPYELSDHTSYFGPFALEYELITLREMGAMPVMYIPNLINPGGGYSGIGVSLVNRLHEIGILLERLQRLYTDAQGYPNKEHYVRLNNPSAGNQGIINCTFGALIDLISTLEQGNRDIDILKNSLRAVANLMYLTDEPTTDELLKHYREREWRITGDFSRNGKPIAQDLTEEDKNYLTELDPIFLKQIEMRDGEIRYVDACYTIKTYEGAFVLKFAKRLVAPQACISETTAILKHNDFDLEVSSLEALSD